MALLSCIYCMSWPVRPDIVIHPRRNQVEWQVFWSRVKLILTNIHACLARMMLHWANSPTVSAPEQMFSSVVCHQRKLSSFVTVYFPLNYPFYVTDRWHIQSLTWDISKANIVHFKNINGKKKKSCLPNSLIVYSSVIWRDGNPAVHLETDIIALHLLLN